MNERTSKAEEQGTLSAAAKTSKVSGNKSAKNKKATLYWILGSIIAVILITMFFSGGGSKSKTQQTGLERNHDYQNKLQQNMARLKQDNRETIVEEITKPQYSKEYIARQNAPTNIYNVSMPEMHTTSGSDVKEVTLADKSTNAAFANQGSVVSAEHAYKIPHPKYTIASGEFIHAELETAISSNLPGMVRAVITRPVYAYVGEAPLIPAGSRLIGQYSSAILQGQDRVMVIWNRIILPNGIAVNVNSPGADELGRAGQGADSINTHFFKRFGEAVLLSVIGAGVANYGISSGDQYNSAADYRMAIAESFQQSAQASLQGTLAIKPTLHVYQGAEINVFVAHDLSFYNVLRRDNG